MHLLQKATLILITGYQHILGPLLPRSCRFTPSCSEYASEAVKKYGVIKGMWLAINRLSRCHPFHVGGYDPVQ